jgi:hypothetical protein
MGGSSEELPPITTSADTDAMDAQPTSAICLRDWTPETTALEAVASTAAPYARLYPPERSLR